MMIDFVLQFVEGRGGVETVLALISQELVRRGHRVRIFQTAQPFYLEWIREIPEIYYYDPLLTGYNRSYNGEIDAFRFALGYRALLEKLTYPDIAIATMGPLQSAVCRIALSSLGLQRPPVISWMHGPIEAYGAGNLLQYSDAHFAISTPIAQQIHQLFPVTAPIYYIRNPIDTREAKRIPRPLDRLELLYIGRLHNQVKRVDVLLKSLPILRGKWHLTIIGDGPDKDDLKNLSDELALTQNVTWLDWQKQPWNAISEASLLVLSSDSEGFGLVIGEALARGIPVVATECGGPEDLVKRGINGWLFPPGESKELAVILQKILDGDFALPTPETCELSVQAFRPQNVVDSMEKAISYTRTFYTP